MMRRSVDRRCRVIRNVTRRRVVRRLPSPRRFLPSRLRPLQLLPTGAEVARFCWLCPRSAGEGEPMLEPYRPWSHKAYHPACFLKWNGADLVALLDSVGVATGPLKAYLIVKGAEA